MTDTTPQPRPYRTREWPSEIVWTVVHSIDVGDDPAERDGFPAFVVAQQVAEHLSIHDSTTSVHDLLPLAVWAVLNGAPADLVTFASDRDEPHRD